MKDKINVNVGGIGFTGALAILFIAFKLLGIIHWPWIWVVAPLWIPIAIALLTIIIILICSLFIFIIHKIKK